MTKHNTIFNLVPGKLYKHTWIYSVNTRVPKRMTFKLEDGFYAKGYLNIEMPLLFVGKLNDPKLVHFKDIFLGEDLIGATWGLFIYQNKLIAMEHYNDIKYEELGA